MGCTTYDEGNTSRQKKGPWTAEEDLLLIKYIQSHGVGKWPTLPYKAGLQRCPKGCRLRWMNYLRPNVKRGNMSLDEEDLIIRLHKLIGNRWSLIAGRIPGRTDNEIKNYWNSHLCKKLHSNVLHHKARPSKKFSSLPELSNINSLLTFNGHLQFNTVDSLVGNQRCKNMNSCLVDLINHKVSNDSNFFSNYNMGPLTTQLHSNEDNLLTSTHFNIGGTTQNYQSHIVIKNERYQHQNVLHNPTDASLTSSSQCHGVFFNTVDQMRELYGVRDDIEISMMGGMEASHQIQGLFGKPNEFIFSSRANNQYSPLPSQNVGDGTDDGANQLGPWNQFSVGCRDVQETTSQLTSYDGHLSSLLEDYSTTGLGVVANDHMSLVSWYLAQNLKG